MPTIRSCSYLLLLPLLLASSSLPAQEKPLLQTSPLEGSLQSSGRPALLTRNPVNQVLPADSAFALQSYPDAAAGLRLHWDIQPGYYLYRKSLQLSDADGTALTLELPAGREITDEYFGTVEVYYDALDLSVTLPAIATAGKRVQLLLEYQGCAEALYCYPPQQKELDFTLP